MRRGVPILVLLAVANPTNGWSIRQPTTLARRLGPIAWKVPKPATSLPSSALQLGVDPAVAVASLSATAKLLASIGLGGLAAKKPNVLDPAAVSALSRLTFWIFQPAFLLCSVSKTMYNASTGGAGLPGRFLALMPLTAMLQIGLGAVVGKLITKFAGMPDEEARDVCMSVTFANSGPLPLIFADALFGGTSLLSDVVACVSFYLLVWSPLFWSYGRVILGTYADGDSGAPKSLTKKILGETKKILSPPVIGSILGVVVGSVPICQRLFFRGLFKPLYGALSTLGTAYLPAALLVLAGSLVGRKPEAKSTEINGDETTTGTNPSLKAIITIFLSRFCLAPLLSLAALQSMQLAGLLGPPGTRARAVITFVVMCEGCMPPAQNSVIMLQLEGLQVRAQSMAKLLTILYSLAVVPVTILLSACLATSSIMSFR